jgi:glutamate/tyrosine decarboxylase-like PLP-dependent enzyme
MTDRSRRSSRAARLLRRGLSGAAARFERSVTRFGPVRSRLDQQYDEAMATLEETARPYRNEYEAYDRLPPTGRDRMDILREMEEMAAREAPAWEGGRVSGGVYNGDAAHIDFLNRVYALNSQANPLHSDVWPSATRFEAEIVAMTAHMLGAREDDSGQICGTVTSGGTESILLAMKTYRDRARIERGIKKPEIVAPVTAHAAFDKASQYFGIRLVSVPVDANYRADVPAMASAITRNAVALVGSSPSFPHGAIDPIPELSELAHARGVGLHVDACLGGFVLPWAERLGYPVPPFDFRLPGVTSMSVDTHKYGYAAKGTSVVLYRGADLRHYQYYTATEWPGGMYFSPTLAGSRPGGLSAACWASLVSTGEAGYMQATRAILEGADKIKRGIREIPELRILGEPLFVIAFASDRLDIYRVLDCMAHRGWSLNGLHKPPAVHIALTLRHTQDGVAEQFLEDLKASVDEVTRQPRVKGGMAPIYGMAATLPLRGVVSDMLKRYLDLLFSVDGK